MAEPTESRYAQILRNRIRQGESLTQAASSAASARLRERADLRRLLPQTGLLGAITESTFGRPYQYRRRPEMPVERRAATQDTGMSNKTLNVIRINTAITAKNSMVLPGMARDMNVMRQNIGKMTKNLTGTAATRADMQFLKAREREAAYENALGSRQEAETNQTRGSSNKSGNIFSSMLGPIGKVLGGGLAITGAVLSSVISGLGSVIGIGAKILGGVAHGLSGLGILGLVALIGAGYMIAQISKNVDFSKFKISDIFGIGEGDKGFFVSIAEKLDTFFGTDKFTKTLTKIESATNQLVRKADILFSGTISYLKSFMDLAMIEMKNVILQFSTTTMTVLAAAAGVKLGLPMLAAGASAGPWGALAAGVAALTLGGEAYVGIKNIQKNLEDAMADPYLTDEQRDVLGRIKTVTEKNPAFIGKMSQLSERHEEGKTLSRGERSFLYMGKVQDTLTGGSRIGEKHLMLSENPYEAMSQLRFALLEETGNEIDLSKLRKDYEKAFSATMQTGKSPQQMVLEQELERARKQFSDAGQTFSTNNTSPTKVQNTDMADLIYNRFREAGFSDVQARAAVANAIAESNLNPNAKNITAKEESYGLFQMNRKGGLGTNHTPENLMDPNYNIGLAIQAAKESKGFVNATTIEQAVSSFVKDVERPANQEAAILKRIQIANNNEAIYENTMATKELNETLKEKAQDTMEDLMKALFQAMLGMSTGTGSVNNITNNSIAGPVASPYNEDVMPLLFKRTTE